MANKDTTVTLLNGQTVHGAPFVVKTFQLLHDPRNNHVISWSPNRDSFIVHNPVEFASEVLPKYFKHNNFCSFIRQLNTYGFKKLETREWEFRHELFSESTAHLLSQILRRKSKKRGGGKDDDDDMIASMQPAPKLSHSGTDGPFALPSTPATPASAGSSRPQTPLYSMPAMPAPPVSPRGQQQQRPMQPVSAPLQYQTPPQPQPFVGTPLQQQQPSGVLAYQQLTKSDEKKPFDLMAPSPAYVQVKAEPDTRDEESKRHREYIQLLLKEVFRLQQQNDSFSQTLDVVTKTFVQQQSAQQTRIDRLQQQVDVLLQERAERHGHLAIAGSANSSDGVRAALASFGGLAPVASSSQPSPLSSTGPSSQMPTPTTSGSVGRTPSDVVDLRDDPEPMNNFRTVSGNYTMQTPGDLQASILNELNSQTFDQDGPDPLFNFGFRASAPGVSLPSTPDMYANIGSPSALNGFEFNSELL